MAQPEPQAQPDTDEQPTAPKPGPMGLPDNFDWAAFEPQRRELGSAVPEATQIAPGVTRLGIKHFAGCEILTLDLSDEQAERLSDELKPSRVARIDGNGTGPGGLVLP